MKSILAILFLTLVACHKEVPEPACEDKVVYITNAGELHTLSARASHPVPEDWAIRCQVLNEGKVEVHQLVIRKGQDRGYVDFQSSDKITTFKVIYCGVLDN